ncbi:MAG: hypothetical protein GY847_14380 [Proteobacteria bacterium]|nr:hypothetical protein [Pseudomonadota bacterium]
MIKLSQIALEFNMSSLQAEQMIRGWIINIIERDGAKYVSDDDYEKIKKRMKGGGE